jgi:hypothetical protein
MLPPNFPDDTLFLMRACWAGISCYILAAIAVMFFIPKGKTRAIMAASIALGFAIATVLLSVMFMMSRLSQ